jgi:hypothetical protein
VPPIDKPAASADVEVDEGPADVNPYLEPTDIEVSRDEDIDNEKPLGREEAITESEIGGTGLSMAIGVGGGASGLWGDRRGGGRKRALAGSGRGRAIDGGIEAALRWFKRHQSPNGQWDVDGYQANCGIAGPKCEPGSEHTDVQGDVACTAYALLCYLGAGYDQRMPSPYRTTVKKGVDWLLAMQTADGVFGERNYEHAIATMALCEAYGMSSESQLKDPAQRAVGIIRARQAHGADGYGLGWNYVDPAPERNDSSVTGWNIMALKDAKSALLDTGDALEGAERWLRSTWKAANGANAGVKDPYRDQSVFPYTYNAVAGTTAKDHLACVGALCAVFLGAKSGDPMLESLSNWIMANELPRAYPTNTYSLYYDTMALFQVGGDRWKQWNDTVFPLLIGAQRKAEDCFDGSWDHAGTRFHGHQTGRLLSTAYCCLSLEVFIRYRRLLR